MNKAQSILKEFSNEIELGVRIAVFIFSISFGMLVLLIGVKHASAADLKPETTITGDYIRLGDIFGGIENADYVLGPAPQPGKDMILNASTLYKIASALNVKWKPTTSTEQVILRRDASIISQETITKNLKEKIGNFGVNENFNITYTSGIQDIILPAGTDKNLEITAFQFDPQDDVFEAVIVSPSKERPIKRINVSGRIERMIPIPVLKNTLRSGDIIGQNDIDFIEVAKNKIGNGIVLNEQDLIDMSPKRTVTSGKPIIANDLEHPKMVDRGDAVTLVFQTGVMILTAKGKSLQSGSMGDLVRVTNLDSNKNLQGTITASREVTIR